MTERSSRRGWTRRGVAVAVIGGAVALLATQTAASSPSRAGAPARVSKAFVLGAGVRGPITIGGDSFTFAVSAVPSKDGSGSLKGSFPGFASFSGVVTCLHINGKMATVGGVFTSGFGYDDDYSEPQHDLTGDWFIWIVQDNGPSKHGSPDMASSFDWGDRAYFTAGGSSSPTVPFPTFASLCDNAAADVATDLYPLLSGDIEIR